jgi:oligopeptide/dipeptide ABC transporter ATP-binding protein
MTECLVRLDNVDVRFDARRGLLRTVPVHAIDGVTLEIHRGETMALVGESGSGKTTLGRASLRLVKPAAGNIVFDGENLSTLRGDRLKAFRRRAQAIAQDPYASLSPYMTIRQIVEEPLVVHRYPPDGPTTVQDGRAHIVEQALEQAGLRPATDFLGRFPHTLSGGQRQRVAIARALVLDPAYVVADEPVSMIDASSRAEILGLLRKLQRRHRMAMLLITHDIANARHFADRIAVMYRGHIVELGLPQQIIEAPLHPYTAALVAAVPEPDPANRHRMRAVVAGEPPDPTTPLTGCPFHPRCPEFIAGTCEVRRPVLAEASAGRPVACHIYPTSSGIPSTAPPSPRQTNEKAANICRSYPAATSSASNGTSTPG